MSAGQYVQSQHSGSTDRRTVTKPARRRDDATGPIRATVIGSSFRKSTGTYKSSGRRRKCRALRAPAGTTRWLNGLLRGVGGWEGPGSGNPFAPRSASSFAVGRVLCTFRQPGLPLFGCGQTSASASETHPDLKRACPGRPLECRDAPAAQNYLPGRALRLVRHLGGGCRCFPYGVLPGSGRKTLRRTRQTRHARR